MDNDDILEHLSTCKDLMLCAKEEIKDIYNTKDILYYMDIVLEQLKELEKCHNSI